VTIHLADSGRVLMIPVHEPIGDSACLRDFTARLTAFSAAVAYVTIDDEHPLTPRQVAEGLASSRLGSLPRGGWGCR
jgi:hypothetical protein